jgi:hypothetical protein
MTCGTSPSSPVAAAAINDMTHKTSSDKDSCRDRVELRFVREISDGDYNREFVFIANEDGLVMDETLIIPWEWIDRAREILGTSSGPQKT